ncbi:FAD-dependent oxidoreductase [Actinocrispum wychmicini]|uniref:2-polyprenyl-6-methoxyphenol hydroxylase-like FAD-dependent oxidoreductase n=1 Tax=Actinocrispum wychmicini TaxID=1213861 RepID=A0A4R2JY64_9PSEU|nr:FAD-dependent oxidoreductase [Actinocrispum wychmicini]TCO62316.1 2-polyprenyl-6-methoxyphenol hydroxylase-like FAD-dependent oxidoreductase [Actinocrispum wychmicini]
MTVVIAGGGPTGLMLACELGLQGVETVVLERLSSIEENSAGMGVHARTLEVLDRRGFAVPRQDMFPWPRTPFALLWLDLAVASKRDLTYALPQWRVERLLAERATELGVEIRRGEEVTGVSQDDTGVTVDLRSGEQLRSRYLVGCDGADSAVRSLVGIDFPKGGRTYYGVLADVVVDEMDFQGGVYPAGMFGALPLRPGMIRLMTVEFDVERPNGPVTVDEVADAVERVTGRRPAIDKVHWLSRFGGSNRLVTRYRDGRVFLAGDAAHTVFISGTQGLNSGVHDAVNLGWKLAAEVNGWAPIGLLDTYHAERHPVGQRMVTHAEAQMALLHPLHNVVALREVFQELLQVPEVNRILLEMPTVDPLRGDVMPDVPLRAGRGLLLDYSGGVDIAGWSDRVDIVRPGPPPETDVVRVLIRPDGQVAYVDRGGNGLDVALRTWFGEPV